MTKECILSNIAEELNKLAKYSSFCEHDGDDSDNRIHLETCRVDTADLNKRQYTQYETSLNRIEFENKAYIIHFWNDSSGYDYWNKDCKENNYIQCTITFKFNIICNLDSEELQELYENITATQQRLADRLKFVSYYY